MRDMDGGCNLCLGQVGVGWVVGGGVCGAVSSSVLVFFGWFCVGMGVVGWLWFWLLLGVDGLLRVVSMNCMMGCGAGGDVLLGVGWVCCLRREWIRRC